MQQRHKKAWGDGEGVPRASHLENVDRKVRDVPGQRVEREEALLDQLCRRFVARDGGIAACRALVGPYVE